MAVKKTIEPKITDATMADIITLINDKFTSSDKYSKLQFDAIQLQLKIVTADIATVQTEIKELNNKLILIDKADAVHYLACPNTLLANDIKPIIKDFPSVKDSTDELKFMRRWFKPSLIGTVIGIIVTLISMGIVFFKLQPEVNTIQAKQTYNEKNIKNNADAISEEQMKEINSILHK